MTEIQCTTKRWGSSLGIIIPKEIVDNEHLKEHETITIQLKKKHKAQEFFGLLKNWKKPTEQIKHELKRGWD